jgi:hypothetical protein
MQYSNRSPVCQVVATTLITVCAWTGASLAANAPAGADGQAVAGIWQHHSAKFQYFGINTRYNCDALEDHVRQLLLHFGARPDLTVKLSGCPIGSIAPRRIVFIATDFYTLAPAANFSAPGAVQGYWVALDIRPWRPFFMGDSDCELVEGMKPLIADNFALQGLTYRTECVPDQINAFSIKARAFKPLPPANTADARR